MAKPGPKPKPTTIKKNTGNPGRRPLPKNEPVLERPARMPAAPAILTDVGKKHWRTMGKKLFKVGLLTEIDLDAFAAYCQHYETWHEATRNIKKHGMLIKAQSGFPMLSPYYTIQAKESAAMLRCLTEFGMTPSSRTRVEIPKEPEKDGMEEFFSGPKIVK